MAHIDETLKENTVIPVATVERADQAVPLADALEAGGIRTMMLMLRTEDARSAMRQVAKKRPDFVLGVGTVLTREDLDLCRDHGIAFAISPGLDPALVEYARKIGMTYMPGVVTPSDVQLAVALGCGTLKLFPAEPAGGLMLLRSLQAVFGHLGVRFIPFGELDPTRSEFYLREPGVLAVAGSWVCPRSTIAEENWGAIENSARAAAHLRALNV